MAGRGKELETPEYVLKAIMNLIVAKSLTVPKNIIQLTNDLRKKDGKEEISERSIRKAMAFLVQSGALKKMTLTFSRILDADDEIIETNSLRTIYEINPSEVLLRLEHLQLERFKTSERFLRAKPEEKDSMIEAQGHDLIEDAASSSSNILFMERSFYRKGQISQSPIAMVSIDAYCRRVLKITMKYLALWNG